MSIAVRELQWLSAKTEFRPRRNAELLLYSTRERLVVLEACKYKSKMIMTILHRELQLKLNQQLFRDLLCLKRGHARCVFWGHNGPLCLFSSKVFANYPIFKIPFIMEN